MFKLEIFCQPEQQDLVLATLHECGVGRIGNYDHCWAIGSVMGSHRALEGSNPIFGLRGQIEKYPLIKVEVNVAQNQVNPLVTRLKLCLGWEEPLVNVFKLHNQDFDL